MRPDNNFRLETVYSAGNAPTAGEYRFLMTEADVKASVPNAISNTAYEVKAYFGRHARRLLGRVSSSPQARL